jgi:hypothetical protein
VNTLQFEDGDMPNEIDFSKGIRGLHHIPAGAMVFMPTPILKDLLENGADKAKP